MLLQPFESQVSGVLMGAALLLLAGFRGACANPVLLISIDGMKPEYVIEADAHGMAVDGGDDQFADIPGPHLGARGA